MTEGLINQQMLIDASPVGMAAYQIIESKEGLGFELKLLQANPAFCDALGMNTVESMVPFTTIIRVQGGRNRLAFLGGIHDKI